MTQHPLNAQVDAPANSDLKKVYLIGAGPGDPGLLTLRGAKLLGLADVILFDGLVNTSILQHARPDAELICVGKHGHGGLWTQSQIDETTVRFAKQGKTVVRLKGGDTGIFARTAEEIERLVLEHIPFEVVPGISTALAVSAYTGIPITHRDWASAVAFVTGQFQPMDGSEADEPLDWQALAKFPGTIVMYMGVTTAPLWSRKLMDAGMAATTPIAIVRKCSLPEQLVLRCTLGNVASTLNSTPKLRPPIVCILGEVVDLGQNLDWFSNRPLMGRNVWITAPAHSAMRLADSIQEFGANTLMEPVMRFEQPSSWTQIDAALNQLSSFDVVAFSSSMGVESFFNRLSQLKLDVRKLANAKIAAVGNATAEQLRKYHLRCDLIPHEANSNSLGELLAQDCRGSRFLFVRNPDGESTAMEKLRALGASVESIEVYQQRFNDVLPQSIQSLLYQDTLHAILATSKNIARQAVRMLGSHAQHQKWYSLAPSITDCLAELGCLHIKTAANASFESLVDLLLHELH